MRNRSHTKFKNFIIRSRFLCWYFVHFFFVLLKHSNWATKHSSYHLSLRFHKRKNAKPRPITRYSMAERSLVILFVLFQSAESMMKIPECKIQVSGFNTSYRFVLHSSIFETFCSPQFQVLLLYWFWSGKKHLQLPRRFFY